VGPGTRVDVSGLVPGGDRVSALAVLARYELSFEVEGTPVGQGALRRSPGGKLYESSKGHAAWRQRLTHAAMEAHAGLPELTGPVEVRVTFAFGRPKAHYGTGRNQWTLRPRAPLAHRIRPDLDHLQRCLGDALTLAGVLHDDSLIACWSAAKIYAEQPGCSVRLITL